MYIVFLSTPLSTLFKISALNAKLQLPIFTRCTRMRFEPPGAKPKTENQLAVLIMSKCWSSYAFRSLFSYFSPWSPLLQAHFSLRSVGCASFKRAPYRNPIIMCNQYFFGIGLKPERMYWTGMELEVLPGDDGSALVSG